MNRPLKSLGLSVVLLLLTTHPLPAPIHEPPAVKATPKPAEKSSPKTARKEPAPKSAEPVKQTRFAGIWVGTMQTFPPGNTATVLTVDSTETTMALAWNLGKPPSAKTQLNGDTLRATFGSGIGAATFSLTPQPDGLTAVVRMQAFMNDFTATFHRTATVSRSAKTAK